MLFRVKKGIGMEKSTLQQNSKQFLQLVSLILRSILLIQICTHNTYV